MEDMSVGCKAELVKTQQELIALLGEPMAPTSLVPGLVAIAREPEVARDLPGTQLVLEVLGPYLADIEHMPLTPYTLYREFRRTGERRTYQEPHHERRAKLCAAAFQVLLGDESYLDLLQDYIWAICEETNWVLPAHENREVALRSVGTGFSLAEISVGLRGVLADEVVERIGAEIERRILKPYLKRHDQLSWWKGGNNWNGVCNSGVGAMFLLLEPDVARTARALALVLEGLAHFLEVAFEADGGSTEGTSYWQYGLSNLIPFAEMLRIRTGGAIDILSTDRVKAIATYPIRTMLSPGHYANFSDCEEVVAFAPGSIAKLAERTGVTGLLGVLAEGAPLIRETNHRRFHTLWRNIAWWNGIRPQRVTIGDVWAQDVGMARLTATTSTGVPLVLATKAGHNAENHNQNDVGSVIFHVDGESLICEPGRGLYSRDYFSPRRYENVFANSYGHSVPRVGEALQSAGAAFRGEIVAYDDEGPEKRVSMEIGSAYDVPGLEGIRRALLLDAPSGDLVLEDVFTFSGPSQPVEETFVTWYETVVAGSTARIVGERHVLDLQIEAPADATFALEVLEEASGANAKPVPLKRLSYTVSGLGTELVARMRVRVRPR
jgi:hypothetical protein